MDPSQYGNLKKTSIQHYLVSLIHRISSSLDRNSKGDIFANCITFYDYSKAFSRLCHKLGVTSFIRNGVRPSLIPLLINYYQNRRCRIKWRGQLSKERLLPGSGAQGGVLGNWEYLSQTNNNTDRIPPDDGWKWVDDLTTIEIVDLITVGLSSYNFREHVASDIPMHGQFVAPENLKTQKYISTLDTWSTEHNIKLNKKKTTIMLINFTKKHQFSTRLKLKDTNIEQVKHFKVLGTILSDDLSWDANCNAIIKKCYARMQLLRKVASFGTDPLIMKTIYIQIIRVVLEGSCQVWAGSLTMENKKALERCQRLCLKIILPTKTYKEAMVLLSIEDLETRRHRITLKFAKNAKYHEKLSKLFKSNPKIHHMKTRKSKLYDCTAYTNRHMKSPILYMQKLLNNLKR